MTYCVGMKMNDGIVMASDSRTNAGLDNVSTYKKMFTYSVGDRSIIIVTSGNLSTSQHVYKTLELQIMLVKYHSITQKQMGYLSIRILVQIL